jgi:hypothetical protein
MRDERIVYVCLLGIRKQNKQAHFRVHAREVATHDTGTYYFPVYKKTRCAVPLQKCAPALLFLTLHDQSHYLVKHLVHFRLHEHTQKDRKINQQCVRSAV